MCWNDNYDNQIDIYNTGISGDHDVSGTEQMVVCPDKTVNEIDV